MSKVRPRTTEARRGGLTAQAFRSSGIARTYSKIAAAERFRAVRGGVAYPRLRLH